MFLLIKKIILFLEKSIKDITELLNILLEKKCFHTLFIIKNVLTFFMLNIFHMINWFLLWICIFNLYKSNNKSYKKYLKRLIKSLLIMLTCSLITLYFKFLWDLFIIIFIIVIIWILLLKLISEKDISFLKILRIINTVLTNSLLSKKTSIKEMIITLKKNNERNK